MAAATAARYLADASASGFVFLGVATAFGWLRRRDRSLGFLALAIVCLSLVAILGRIQLIAGPVAPYVSSISLVAFLASGYALLRFRGSFLPLRPRWHVAVVASMVAAGAIEIAATALQPAGGSAGPLGTLGLVAVLATWSAAVGEPTVRFWLASRGLPAVQRWRLRALSLGLAALVAVIVVTVLASSLVVRPVGQIATQLVVLLIIPLLYISFAPPSWLRRAWRASEEEGARRAMDEILLRSGDRSGLAEAAVGWAMRLVGAEAAAMVDGDGTVEASQGADPEVAAKIAAGTSPGSPIVTQAAVGAASRTVMRVPIVGARGTGSLVLVAGAFTPVFGSEEVTRVAQFASALGPALERFRLIAELQETNARLAEASRHKSAFLANMSHELRTPLNAILGFSELLIDDATFEFDLSTRHGFLEQIHSSGKHLLALINDILDLSKVEAGQMELRMETVTVSHLIQQVIDTVEAVAGKKGIQLEAKTSRAGSIVADAGKVRQMLLNLVSNAIKFTPEGGRVTVTARRSPGWVEIAVVDTGIGIDKADQERVFRQFEQVDSGVSRQQQGTGLGLTLTKRFAELHGGSLDLYSKPAKGSVFTLHLPHQPPSQTVRSESLALASTERDATRPLVLIVEDDAQAAELLVRHLNRGGFRTEVASDGAEALSKARELQPAAITLDVLLPKLDGWTVLTHLGRDDATKRIPVLVVSVVDDPDLGLALGAIDYMVKPVDGKDLLERIRRLQFGKVVAERSVRLLVVDDEEANRYWLKTVLEPAGYDVIAAKNGREALEMVSARRPDLVLLDLVMPEMSGFDVVEAMSAQDEGRTVPIVIITSKDLTEAEKQMLNGRVAATLGRASTGAADLLLMLDQITAEPVHP